MPMLCSRAVPARLWNCRHQTPGSTAIPRFIWWASMSSQVKRSRKLLRVPMMSTFHTSKELNISWFVSISKCGLFVFKCTDELARMELIIKRFCYQMSMAIARMMLLCPTATWAMRSRNTSMTVIALVSLLTSYAPGVC